MVNITVLVVDDEKPLRDFVRRNLDVRGFNVRVASNGLEAIVTGARAGIRFRFPTGPTRPGRSPWRADAG